jgi:hypothetical protein
MEEVLDNITKKGTFPRELIHPFLGNAQIVKLFGIPTTVYKSPDGQHSNVNILGTNVLWSLKISIDIMVERISLVLFLQQKEI